MENFARQRCLDLVFKNAWIRIRFVLRGQYQTGSATLSAAEFRKITTFKGKTQYLMNTLYVP